jgi:two-component system OmpR family sensor kinase
MPAPGSRRRSLSLRARLLAGLIVLTACFLVVMGVVSSVVLGRLEQSQFNTSLRLTATQPVARIAAGADGFAAAYLSLRTGATGDLTPSTPATDELRAALTTLAGDTTAQLRTAMTAHAPQYQPFTLTPASGTGNASAAASVPMRVAWRSASDGVAGSAGLPPGRNIILIGRPVSSIGSQVSGLVTAELITGAALLALLAITGSWLIARGLAPLDRMARAADLISGSGDLTARVPGGGRHETGRLAAAINTMLERIQHAFSARLASERKVRQFAADASHELRTPLTTIKGYAELYRQGALGPDDLPNAMRRIEQESDRMSMLVAELLELARLDRGSSLDLTETDLAALARDAVADARAVEPDRPVTADAPPSLVVTADEPRIRQVLANLLGNVRAHTPPGTPATVRIYAKDGGAVIEVADEGPGMPERDAALAFNRFYRGARGTSHADGSGTGASHADGSDTPGSGLGLSIVEAIAGAHGGSARLRSVPGRGTSVELWIPTPLSRTPRCVSPSSRPTALVPSAAQREDGQR